MSVLINADQLRQVTYGVTPSKGPSVVPTGSTGLFVVSGGPVRITGITAVVTTVFTATATTLNMGAIVAATGVASAVSLFSAATLTSLPVGAVLTGIPTPAVPIEVAVGNVTWIASAGNTGQLQVYLSYIPAVPGAVVN